jgi:hypothetical protein
MLAACAPAPAAPTPARDPGSATAPGHGGQAMIDELLDLGLLLSQDPLTMEQVSARVGPVLEDGGRDRASELRPVDPRWRSVRVSRDRDTGAPYLLQLAPVEPLAVAALRARLGGYERLRSHEDLPRQVLFQLPDAGLPYRAALIASLADGPAIDDATVILAGLRRDPRLE